MNGQMKVYRVKSAIMGGGLSLREGQIVSEEQLKGYVEWLQRAGGIEEVERGEGVPPQRNQNQAYTA